MRAALIVYVVGVIVGLVWADARPAARVALAVLWPVGLLAFAVTVCVLIGASAIAFPLFGATLVAALVVLWAFMR